MLRVFLSDLHVHTCLSPCGDLEMSPRKITEEARRKGIAILGVCDHNSAENAPALLQAGLERGVVMIPGLEVTSREEVHILALFDRVEAAFALQQTVYDHLPGENDEEAFGLQVVVNALDEVTGFNSRLLIGATTLSLDRVVGFIHELEGLAIASHVDREAHGLIGQLGMIPEDLDLDALEVSPRTRLEGARARLPARIPLLTASDAHYLGDIGAATTKFLLQEGTVGEIRQALRGQNGRRLIH
ncbi:MAG: PHP domain-containing protein [Candidatus Aminicenantes bacterium]|nr:PHP domain-containing protein [Candidatus Aminicenantes bacterium]